MKKPAAMFCCCRITPANGVGLFVQAGTKLPLMTPVLGLISVTFIELLVGVTVNLLRVLNEKLWVIVESRLPPFNVMVPADNATARVPAAGAVYREPSTADELVKPFG